MPSPSLTINNSGGSTDQLSQVISGTADGVDAGSTVFIYDNGQDTPIGSASVGADHTWSANIALAASANRIVARMPYGTGSLSSDPVDLTFEPTLSPPSGGQANRGGAASIGHVGALHQRWVQAEATPEAFVFGHHPGHVHLAGFSAAGQDHDRILLPASEFSSIADVLHRISSVGHSAVLTLDAHDTITFTNVAAHLLKAHPQAFRLHG